MSAAASDGAPPWPEAAPPPAPRHDPVLRRALAAGAVVLALYFVAVYHGGTDSYVRVNDHLDGIVPLYKLLAETQPVLGGLDDRVPRVFGGIPRNSLPSGLHLGTLLYYVLPPFAAHVVHEVAMRAVALVGMLLLLRRRLLPDAGAVVLGGSALAFALLPFLPTGYLAVAGQPLLLWALLEIRDRRAGAGPWAVVLVYPFYASLVFTGLFIVLFAGLLVVWDAWRRRRVPWGLATAVCLMGLFFLVSEYRVLYQNLLTDYVSHRSAFERVQGSLRQLVKATLLAFFATHRHAPSVQSPLLLGGVVLGLGVAVRKLAREGAGGLRCVAGRLRRSSAPLARHARIMLVLVGLAAVAALLVGLWEWEPVQTLWERAGPLRLFNFHRVQWFQPLLFTAAFALALQILWWRGGALRGVACVLLAAQLGWVLWHDNAWAEARDTGLTWREYYSPALFDEVAAALGGPPSSHRVVSFGLTPSIALYNGFAVVDGFVNDYPLAYKERFRRVIAGELARDDRLRRHFDGWGGHVDMFSSELGTVSGYGKTVYTRDAPKRAVDDLAIDVEALRDLGAEYVLSAVEIRNHEELGLRLVGRFTRPDSPWEIRVYAVPEEGVAGPSSVP